MSDNYRKLTLLPSKKNIDLTVKIDILMTNQIENMKLTLSIQSSCKKSSHSITYYAKKLTLLEKFSLFINLFVVKALGSLKQQK